MKGIILSLVFVFSFTLSSAQSCYTFTQALSVGSRGGEVTRVQYFLYQNGYLPVAPTGYFGNLTHNAVKQYQASKGLDTVGNVGPLTRQALSVDTCSYSSNTNNVSAQNSNLYTNTQATNNNYVVPVSFTSLDEVVTLNIPYGSLLNLPTLQTRTKYPTYTFSGWYSDPTYTTQYNSQLPVSNSVATVNVAGSVLGVSAYQFERELSLGSAGEDVLKLQKVLNTFGFNVEETGHFGEMTKSALKKFQEEKGLYILLPLGLSEGTGVFGKSSMNYINDLFINLVE